MKVTIDPYAGFCFGVERAVRIAEDNMFGEVPLKSLGELVHNDRENIRLSKKGLKAISHENFINLKQGRVLFRAHGEAPRSYKVACRNNTRVYDATCPVVKKLQSRIAKAGVEAGKKGGVVMIFGRKDHPEVIGLAGNAGENCIVIEKKDDLEKVNLPAIIRLYAQTTRGTEDFLHIQDEVRKKLQESYRAEEIDFKAYNTVCKQVSGREKSIRKFAGEQDVILFVGGKDSSNGRLLYNIAKEVNPRSFYITGKEEIKKDWLKDASSVGITGATSTPDWLMEAVGKEIEKY